MPFTNNPNNFYQNQYQAPIPNYQQPQPMQDYYVSCNNYETVINYPQAPNTRIWFIDDANNKVYRKVRDIQGGVPVIDKEYDLVEVIKPKTEEVKYDEGELNKLYSEVKRLASELESMKPIIEELKS